MTKLPWWLVMALVTLLAHGPRAKADVILWLTTGGTQRVGGGESMVEILISGSNTGSTSVSIVQFNLGLQVIPSGDPGLVTIDVTSIGAPAVDSAWGTATTTTVTPVVATLVNGALNGTTDYWSMSLGTDDIDVPGTISAGSWKNLAAVTLTISGTGAMESLWNIFAVNESPGLFPVTSILDADFNTVQFGNLTVSPEGSDSASLRVFEVAVVPEPTTGVMFLTSALAFGVVARRVWSRGRRRR